MRCVTTQIFHDGCQLDGGTGPLAVVAFTQETVDATDGELKSGPR